MHTKEFHQFQNPKSILVVEDDLTVQPALERMIHQINPQARIEWTTTAEEAFVRLATGSRRHANHYDVVLSDIHLAGEMTGLELVDDCRREEVATSFVLASGSKGVDTSLPLIAKPFRFTKVQELLSPYLTADAPVAAFDPSGLEAIWSYGQALFENFKQKRDQQMEWMLFVASLYICAWVFSELVVNLRHLPLHR